MPSVLGGFVGERLSAPYKDLPVHPLVSPAVDFSFRNISKVRPSCANCFPQTSQDLYHNYVDLFDFPKVSYNFPPERIIVIYLLHQAATHAIACAGGYSHKGGSHMSF
ncbi:unnamed protein product [Haemonchus placei]|uniref:Uncharacterized protein n=1 Tax=Haemonchus placei TaxID=6290 RepID=A0A0N4WIR5_HAEPC|nr:unnamed protein product [Haemonchus placei]